MFFKRKEGKSISCPGCESKIDGKYSYCPRCGLSLADREQEFLEFGMLGKNDFTDEEILRTNMAQSNLGFLDRIFTSLMNNLIKSVSQQMQDAEVKSYPGGIRIKIGGEPSVKKKPEAQKSEKKTFSEEQIKKMSELPRIKAKTTMRRLGDKVIYELSTPGITSPEDIFLAKLETGYEIKAIADNKIYSNSLPINLPLKNIKLQPDKILIEFRA